MTGATGAASGTAAHHQVRFVVIRRPAVRVATANMRDSKPSRAAVCRTAQTITRDTTASAVLTGNRVSTARLGTGRSKMTVAQLKSTRERS